MLPPHAQIQSVLLSTPLQLHGSQIIPRLLLWPQVQRPNKTWSFQLQSNEVPLTSWVPNPALGSDLHLSHAQCSSQKRKLDREKKQRNSVARELAGNPVVRCRRGERRKRARSRALGSVHDNREASKWNTLEYSGINWGILWNTLQMDFVFHSPIDQNNLVEKVSFAMLERPF